MKHVQKFNEASIDTSIESLDVIKDIQSLIDDLDYKSQDIEEIVNDISARILSLTRSDSGLKDEAFEQIFDDLANIEGRLENSMSDINKIIIL